MNECVRACVRACVSERASERTNERTVSQPFALVAVQAYDASCMKVQWNPINAVTKRH